MTSERNEKPEKYQQALDWAEAGEYSKALAYIQSYLEDAPNDVEAMNDAGTILWCQGLSEEALTYLEKAWRQEKASPAVLWNLFEIHLSLAQGKAALQLLEDMERLDILNVDVLNRLATVLIDAGELSEALSVLNRSMAMNAGQTRLQPILDVVRTHRARQETTV
jgi:predicted Zn-dependent protease